MLNPLEMERFLHSLAKRADLRVVWENAEKPRTDGETVFLPRMQTDITQQQYNVLRSTVVHEVDHTLYSDFDLLRETNIATDTSFLGFIWNATEDRRIEALGCAVYEGDRLCANEVHPERMRGALKALAKAAPEVQDKVLPLLAFVNKSWSEMYPAAHGVQREIEAMYSPAGQAIHDKFEAGDYADVLRNDSLVSAKRAGSQATLDLAKRIYNEVYGLDAEKEQERLNPPPPDKAKGKGEEGAGEGKGEASPGEGEAKAEGEGDSTEEGKGKGKPKEGGDAIDGVMSYAAYVPGEAHNLPGRPDGGLSLDYRDHPRTNSYTNPVADDYVVHRDVSSRYGVGGYERVIKDALAATSTSFAHQVRRVLQIRAKDKYTYGTKRGKLHSSALFRVLVPDAHGYNERVFKRKQTMDVLDAAVSLVVDQSGSMNGGGKYAAAAAAAVMLSDVVGNVLHIPVEVTSFTQVSSMNTIYIHREFKDKLVDTATMVKSLALAAEDMHNNLDGEAVLWSFDRLMQRPEKRKLMVVFSDGQPAGYDGRGDIVWHLQQVVQAIEDTSPVNIVGIGIKSDAVREYYTENYVISDPTELEHALLSLIQSKLK